MLIALSRAIMLAGPGAGAALPADNGRFGLVDYNDLATDTTPINIVGGAAPVAIPNDGAGAFTNKSFLPVGVTDVWNASTGLFDWAELKLGDMVDLRLDVEVTTTSPNQEVEISLELAVGGAPYTVPFVRQQFKNAGPQTINRYNGIYLGDTNTLANPARFRIESDAAATLKVNGWYCKILIRG